MHTFESVGMQAPLMVMAVALQQGCAMNANAGSGEPCRRLYAGSISASNSTQLPPVQRLSPHHGVSKRSM